MDLNSLVNTALDQPLASEQETEGPKKFMNIGKLVREKMKLHRTDCSGEYVDNTGKHFTMKVAGEGYTVSYGGEKMREVDISKEQGLKLAGNCRKLELKADGE